MKRPRIVCHGFTSIDGRTQQARWSAPAIGTRPNVVGITDRQALAAMQSDGIITGVVAVAGAPGLAIGRSRTTYPRALSDHFSKRLERPLCFVHDPDAILNMATDRYEEGQIVLITSRRASDEYLENARLSRVAYVFAGDDGMALEEAMHRIQAKYGLSLLVLRADGKTNAAFMAAGLVDQISVLVFPGLDGMSERTSFFEPRDTDPVPPAAGKSLLHVSTQTLDGGIVWLRYLVEEAIAV